MLDFLKFDWAPLRVAIDGESLIDSPRLNVRTKNEAKQFLLSYGYDVDDPTVKEELWRIYFEAVSFIRMQLLDDGEKMPEEFAQRSPQTDILRLLTEASNGATSARSQNPPGRWSCSILRVMHIISHLDNDVRLEHFNEARQQIFDRFDAVVRESGPRRWKFGTGPGAVTLVRYIKKMRKERNSIIVKLLSKPTNITEAIFDSLGFRFVTESRFDAFRLVQALFDTGVVAAANIQPGRSVNSLIPFESLKEAVELTRRQLEEGEISVRLARRRIQKLEEESALASVSSRNPFSSSWYRALQFTGRQLIAVPDPTFRFWNQVRGEIQKNKTAASVLKKIPITLRERRTFYHPFEIQVMDVESYVESIGGRSRHREYKAKQRLMARNRVLRDLI